MAEYFPIEFNSADSSINNCFNAIKNSSVKHMHTFYLKI